jgi:hypothetical protein
MAKFRIHYWRPKCNRTANPAIGIESQKFRLGEKFSTHVTNLQPHRESCRRDKTINISTFFQGEFLPLKKGG